MAEGQLCWGWEFDRRREFENGNGSEAYPQLEYTGCVSLVSTKANGLPPWIIHNTSWTPWWVEERRASEKYTAYMASSNKKTKRNLSESDSENEAADFPRFIVI